MVKLKQKYDKSTEALQQACVMPSLPLSELKKILWATRLNKRQYMKNKKQHEEGYNAGWTDCINTIIEKIEWQ